MEPFTVIFGLPARFTDPTESLYDRTALVHVMAEDSNRDDSWITIFEAAVAVYMAETHPGETATADEFDAVAVLPGHLDCLIVP